MLSEAGGVGIVSQMVSLHVRGAFPNNKGIIVLESFPRFSISRLLPIPVNLTSYSFLFRSSHIPPNSPSHSLAPLSKTNKFLPPSPGPTHPCLPIGSRLQLESCSKVFTSPALATKRSSFLINRPTTKPLEGAPSRLNSTVYVYSKGENVSVLVCVPGV